MSTPPSLVILRFVTAAHVPAAVATTGGKLFAPSRVRLGEQLLERTRATSTLPYHVRRMFCPWATECANHHVRCNLRPQRLKTTDTDMFEMTSQQKEVARDKNMTVPTSTVNSMLMRRVGNMTHCGDEQFLWSITCGVNRPRCEIIQCNRSRSKPIIVWSRHVLRFLPQTWSSSRIETTECQWSTHSRRRLLQHARRAR